MRFPGFVVLIGLCAGCVATPPGPGPAPDPPAFADGGQPLRRAVVAGLTAVDPAAYNGWRGSCPGADVDAEVFAELCREQGVATLSMRNEEATRAGFEGAVRSALRGMSAGDLLVLYLSGHGGQVADGDATEPDGLSETLCLWDGEMTDTYLSGILADVPAGARVFLVTDTCNSGTNYRRRRNLRRAMPAPFAAALIHFGGCADGASSYGSAQGGVFTTALIDAWRDGISYKAWFEEAERLMRSHPQVPVYDEYGAVTDEFRHGQAFR